MTHDPNEAYLDRYGRTIRSAYRATRLAPTQHERHRARLSDHYAHPAQSWVTRAGAAIALASTALLVLISASVWSSLTPTGNDQDERAGAALTYADVGASAAGTPSTTDSADDALAGQESADIMAERAAAIPYAPPDTCQASEWTGPENRTGGWYPASLTDGEDWRNSYYVRGNNVTLNSRLGVLYEGPNTLVWITSSDQPPMDWDFHATLLDSPNQFGIGGMERMGFESTAIDDPRHPGTTLALHGQTLTFDVPGCWLLSVQSNEVSFSHTFYVFPRIDRTNALGHERLYAVEDDGRAWGWDLEEEAKNLFQISVGGEADMALSPDGTRLYLVNREALIAVDAVAGTELWRVPVANQRKDNAGAAPTSVAVSQDGELLFVNANLSLELQSVQIFDARDGAKIGETAPMSGLCPAEIHASADNETLWLVCIRFGGLRAIDLDTSERVVAVTSQFSGSAVSPDGQTLYAVATSGRLLTISLADSEIVDDTYLDLPQPPAPLNQLVAVSTDGERLFVGLADEANSDGVRKIAVVDLATQSTVAVIEADFFIDGKGIEIDGEGRLYVNAAGQIMQLTDGEAEVLRFFVEMNVRQFLIASPDE